MPLRAQVVPAFQVVTILVVSTLILFLPAICGSNIVAGYRHLIWHMSSTSVVHVHAIDVFFDPHEHTHVNRLKIGCVFWAQELRRDVEAGRAVATNRWDGWVCLYCGWELTSEIRFPAMARKRHLLNHGIREDTSRYGGRPQDLRCHSPPSVGNTSPRVIGMTSTMH